MGLFDDIGLDVPDWATAALPLSDPLEVYDDFTGGSSFGEDVGGFISDIAPLLQVASKYLPAPAQPFANYGMRSLVDEGYEVAMGTGPKVLPPAVAMGTALITKTMSKTPLLATAIYQWGLKGIKLSPDKLWSLARRFGPNFLVGAGILSTAALTELILSRGTQHRRRMNPLNPKALSRSMRRLAGFECRAKRVAAQLSGMCRSGPRRKVCK